ncbi:MAG: WhiB family transcriptional regulator, redox-sensing transcriptional regulator [Pseudonocardiales bacterium]|jgi:WhiB family redox-sensing transcriptional regulator|nr:WhiB family transcriptional regulator, redox-sensing transcriptional regulator [Pseudonocardiales bacterium]
MSASRLTERPRVTGDSEWPSRGACRDVDPETLFVVGAAQHKAKSICMGCPVRIDCLADALDSRAEFGVWGGMTERERRTLLRRRPDVGSWRAFFQTMQRSEVFAAIPPVTIRTR